MIDSCQETVNTNNNTTRIQDKEFFKRFKSQIQLFVKFEEFAPSETQDFKLQLIYEGQPSKSAKEEEQYITGHVVIVMSESSTNSQEITGSSVLSS